MQRSTLVLAVTGTLILGGSLGWAEEPRASGKEKAQIQTKVDGQSGIPSFEERLGLKPLTDEELSEITAAGLGPAMPFPFQPSLFLLFQPTLVQPQSVQNNLSNTTRFQGTFLFIQ